uniref:NADH-ubiquinone oxidoreductase chain 3 n=1 Tax=Callitettix braconoides TaxID=1245213 RepID=A0A096VHX0_9HEMI|nr:NADH dehydrogenase subunit 3 [Callitettix braconoides]AFV32147.1 NADH dehydrogenase subunit 3 [Callitettix braconoides]
MMKIMNSSMLIMLIISMLMMITMMVSKKSLMDREKSSPFECGFDPINSPRISFSLHFFLMAVIFLIFDVEIVLILPITIMTKFMITKEWMMSSLMLIIVIIMGLYHEWNKGMLQWSN